MAEVPQNKALETRWKQLGYRAASIGSPITMTMEMNPERVRQWEAIAQQWREDFDVLVADTRNHMGRYLRGEIPPMEPPPPPQVMHLEGEW